MRLVEFLIKILETHTQTLQRLAAFFGEETFIEMLEEAGERPTPSEFELLPEWFESSHPTDRTSPYAELEGSVREFNLSALLEFHLWAYPFYRTLIESSLDLNSRIRTVHSDAAEILIQEAIAQSKTWFKNLSMASQVESAAEQAAIVPWLRFRAEVLKKVGKRPIIAVSDRS